MKALVFSRMPLAAAAFALFAASPAPVFGFLDFFKKSGDKRAPSGPEKQAQEAAASSMLRDANAANAAGNTGKAAGIYDSILKQYPFTDTAAEAAYEKARIVRQGGQLQDAFDAFQKLITDYRQSARFADAIQQQYEIAEEAKGGKKQKNFIVIPMKLTSDDVIAMYRTVIQNAPFGKFAPLAQFSIAEVHQDKSEKSLAIAAYQGVVDNYPSSPQASEAQFRIGQISNVAAKKSQDAGNLTTTRDALTTYVATNPAGERAGEAQVMLEQVTAEEAQRSLNVGKFYEKQGKVKAASIYYNEALKFGSPEASNEARERLASLSKIDPGAMSDDNMKAISDYTPTAATDLRSRDDYAGPPSPELAALTRKPKMRADDGFQPIPLVEPKLPIRPGGDAPPVPGSLLPPAELGKPMLLPIPPAPNLEPPKLEVPAPPVPPAPGAGNPKPAAPAAPPAEPKPVEPKKS